MGRELRLKLGLSHYLAIILVILLGGLSIYSSLDAGEPRIFDVSVDDDPIRGDPDAQVTLVEFSDYACPSCKAFQPIAEQILADYSGQVRLVYRDFPFLTQNSRPAAEASQCVFAQDPDLYWAFHDVLFEEQEAWRTSGNAVSLFEDYASDVGVPDLEEFMECLSTGQYRDEVEADKADGESYEVTGTPTVYVNGRKLQGVPSYEVLSNAIEEALSDQQ